MAIAEREREISFNIRKKIGVIATYQTGWKKEVNLVEWNGGPAKVDIRDWDPSHTHMGKGITLYPKEADRLRWLLYQYFTGAGAEKQGAESEQDAAPEQSAAEQQPAAEQLDAGLPAVHLTVDPETGEIQEAPVTEQIGEAPLGIENGEEAPIPQEETF